MAKTRLDDKAVRALRMALRSKLGISKEKPKKAAKEETEETVDDAPRAQRAKRLGYADL
jgi:hypothetical protein